MTNPVFRQCPALGPHSPISPPSSDQAGAPSQTAHPSSFLTPFRYSSPLVLSSTSFTQGVWRCWYVPILTSLRRIWDPRSRRLCYESVKHDGGTFLRGLSCDLTSSSSFLPSSELREQCAYLAGEIVQVNWAGNVVLLNFWMLVFGRARAPGI